MISADHTTTTPTDILDRLTEGIARLTDSDEWVRYLDTQRRFPSYSFNNTMLIYLQRPDATLVAGFHAWKRLGRTVTKGERGIRIIAPVISRRQRERVGTALLGSADTTSESGSRNVVAYRPVVVFDLAQTEGLDIPQAPCHLLDGSDVGNALAQLQLVAETLGFTVEVTADLPGERNGDCSHLTHRIRVRADRSPLQQVKTLAHEIGHAILHGDALTSRPLAELEAESVAYVVCDGLGLDSGSYSFGYTAGWGGGPEAITAIRASGERIRSAAARISVALAS